MIDGLHEVAGILAGHVPVARSGPGRDGHLRIHPGVERVHDGSAAPEGLQPHPDAVAQHVPSSSVGGAVNWGAVMAGSTMVAVPVIIFFLIVQGRMTGGLVAGAVKG